MYRTEFLGILKSQLSGQMQEGKVAAHLRYYEDYIQSKVRSGINEEEAIKALGDPRLIAKTLLDTDIDNGIYEEEASSSQGYSRGSYNSQSTDSASSRRWYKKLDLSTWYGKLIVIATAALIIFLLVTVLTAVAPFFIMLAIVLFVLSKLRKR